MDAGPILAQETVPVLPDDTEAVLHERIKQVERVLYPVVVERALEELEAGRAIVPKASIQKVVDRKHDHMRALLSVYDKEGLIPLARGLSDLGWSSSPAATRR